MTYSVHFLVAAADCFDRHPDENGGVACVLKDENEKRLSDSPLLETFTEWVNIKRLLIAFFGICGGMTCAYYIAVLYPTSF